MNYYTILVNSCDKFHDCWVPYFKLHTLYWPDCTAKLCLNTEIKDFTYPGIDIAALKVCENTNLHQLTWSECLSRALEKIGEDVVLYMQEDYFLKGPVQNGWVEKYVQLMHKDKSIDCIHLTDQAVIHDGQSKYEGLFEVKLRQRYRISCQAALWRKDVLKEYLRSHENAWQFEEFGSKRSAKMKHNFYVVDPSQVRLDQSEIVPYIFTGIVQGRWKEEVVPLFAAHDIDIDYALRGFLKDAPARSLTVKASAFCNKLPLILKSYIDLFF